ncbi:MAG: T9SS type A sorting domain-containing protein [Bacteroidales bacterium]|nr:T9SS type A sorting domain-containing protein [Bacteroidales bacterium]
MKRTKRLLLALVAVIAAASWTTSSAYNVGDTLYLGGVMYKIPADSVPNLIPNGNFADSLNLWVAGDNNPLTAAKFTWVKTGGGVNDSTYIKSLTNEGGGEAGSIRTAWPLTQGKGYLFSYYAKYNDTASVDGQSGFHKTAATNTVGTETLILIGDGLVGGKDKWKKNEVAFFAGHNLLQVNFRWLGTAFAFDNFKLCLLDSIGLDPKPLNDAIANAETYLPLDFPGKTALQAAIDAAKTAATQLTSAKDITDNIALLDKAVRTYRLTELPLAGDSIDFTFTIINPGISGATGWTQPKGWTVSAVNGNGFTNKGQHYSLDANNYYFDSWNWTAGKLIFNAAQTVAEIPNGTYMVSAAGRSSGTKAYIYANNRQTEIINNGDQNGELGKGWNTIKVDTVVVTNNQITFGAKTVTGWTGTWFGADDFKLAYWGEIPADYRNELDKVIPQVEALNPDTLPDGLDTLIVKALAKADTVTLSANILNSITELKSLLADADTAMVDFATLKATIVEAEAVDTTYAGIVAFRAAIAKAKNTVKAPTTLSKQLDPATAELLAAIKAYKFTKVGSAEDPVDASFAIVNPSFETGNINGWTATSGTGDMGAKPVSNATYKMNPVDGSYVFNIWAGSAMNFFVEQEVTGLPDGIYSMTALVASDSSNVITLYLNGVEQALKLVTKKDSAVNLTVGNVRIKNGTAKLGAKSGSWFKADHFRLSYVPLVDKTSAIVNPGITAASNNVVPEGWTINKGVGNSFSNTGQHYSGVTSNRYLDSWNGTAGAMIYNASQVVDSIPNGVYLLKAAARSSGQGAYIYGNNKQTQIIQNGDQNGAMGRGWNMIAVDSVVVMDNTITIGAKTTTGWTGTWFSADDFSLFYIGEGDSASYKPVLDELIAKAKAFDLTTTPDGEDALLLAAITTAENTSDMLEAYSGLKKAYDAIQITVAPFTALKAQYDKDTLLAKTTSYPGLATFNAAITAAEGVIAGANTLNADVIATTETLKKATIAYLATQNAPADFSFAMVNPSFEEGRGGTLTPGSTQDGNSDLPLGWNVTRNSTWHNSVLYTTNPYDGKTAYEMWSGTINYFGVDQTIETPRAGFYTLSAMMRSNHSTSKTGAFNDAHVYAKLDGDSLLSGYLGNAPGFNPGDGWNSVAAWKKVSVSFRADSGDVIKIGAAATCFLQFDDFRLKFLGENDPKTIDVGYLTKVKAMTGAGADTISNDAIFRMLSADTLIKVHLYPVSDVSATSPIDLSPYDVLIIQESIGGGDKILTPAGPLALKKLPIPTLYNKAYAFKKDRALTAAGAGSATGAETEGVYTITVDAANQSNDLFKGITFIDNQAAMFKAGADDNGGDTKSKALNFANAVSGAQKSLLAYPTGSTPTLAFNDIQAGDTIGGEVIKSRMITFGMNFGAIARDGGVNVTNENYTLWRNAVYMLAGLPVPSSPVIIDAVKKVAVNSFDIYPNPTSDRLNINGLDESSLVRIYNLTGKQLFVGKAEQATMSIDLSTYDKGLYLLQVETNGKSFTSKVIKK